MWSSGAIKAEAEYQFMVNAEKFIEEAIVEIKREVGTQRAIIALSGGVDSSVCATLAYQALGDRIKTVSQRLISKCGTNRAIYPPREGDDCSLSSYFSLDFYNCFLNELLCVYHKLILCFCFDLSLIHI